MKIINFILINILPLFVITMIALSIFLPELFVYIRRKRSFPQVNLIKMEIIKKEEKEGIFKIQLETPKGNEWVEVNTEYYHIMDIGDYACCHVTYKRGEFKNIDFVF